MSGFVKRYLTVPEVAERFSVSRRFVYTLIQRRQLEVINLGGAVGSRGVRITVDSVQRLEEVSRVDPDQFDE